MLLTHDSKTILKALALYTLYDEANILFTFGLRIFLIFFFPLTHSCVDFKQYFCTFNKRSSILFSPLVLRVFTFSTIITDLNPDLTVYVLKPLRPAEESFFSRIKMSVESIDYTLALL